MLLCERDRRAGAVGILRRTPIRTFSHLSPSMMSSPPRPLIMSLPSPPRMMSPALKDGDAGAQHGLQAGDARDALPHRARCR